MEELYQPNLNQSWKLTDKDIALTVMINPITEYNLYDDYHFLEYGNKIIIPKIILYELSNYDNITYPLNIKINETIFGVLEFKEDIDAIYIPTKYFIDMDLEIGIFKEILILHNELPKGDTITLKPYTNQITDIPNITEYLTENLKKYYSSLTVGDIIELPYDNSTQKFELIECIPDTTVSIIDVDIDVIIETSYEYDEYLDQQEKHRKARLLQPPPPPPIPQNNDENTNNPSDNSTSFVAFSGKGRKLTD